MNNLLTLFKCYSVDIIDQPLEITFVSWPMVRYRREVLFGWVDLLGKSIIQSIYILLSKNP